MMKRFSSRVVILSFILLMCMGMVKEGEGAPIPSVDLAVAPPARGANPPPPPPTEPTTVHVPSIYVVTFQFEGDYELAELRKMLKNTRVTAFLQSTQEFDGIPLSGRKEFDAFTEEENGNEKLLGTSFDFEVQSRRDIRFLGVIKFVKRKAGSGILGPPKGSALTSQKQKLLSLLLDDKLHLKNMEEAVTESAAAVSTTSKPTGTGTRDDVLAGIVSLFPICFTVVIFCLMLMMVYPILRICCYPEDLEGNRRMLEQKPITNAPNNKTSTVEEGEDAARTIKSETEPALDRVKAKSSAVEVPKGFLTHFRLPDRPELHPDHPGGWPKMHGYRRFYC